MKEFHCGKERNPDPNSGRQGVNKVEYDDPRYEERCDKLTRRKEER